MWTLILMLISMLVRDRKCPVSNRCARLQQSKRWWWGGRDGGKRVCGVPRKRALMVRYLTLLLVGTKSAVLVLYCRL